MTLVLTIDDWIDAIFRFANLGGLVALAIFMSRIVKVVKEKAVLEHRVETHLNQSEPLIEEFQTYKTRIAILDEKHTALVHNLNRFIEVQDDANRSFREAIDQMMLKIAKGR